MKRPAIFLLLLLAGLFGSINSFAFQSPKNDKQSQAHQLPLDINGNFFSRPLEFSASGATGENRKFKIWGDPTSRDVWFSFKAPASDKTIITVDDGFPDTKAKPFIQIALVDSEGKEIGSYTSGYPSHSERLIAEGLQEGQEYFILVDNPADGAELKSFNLSLQTYKTDRCVQPITLNLDALGKSKLELEKLLPEDCYWPCAGPGCTREVEKTEFSCQNLGDNFIKVKGIGSNGKTYFGTALVKVADITPPTIAVKEFMVNITNGSHVDVDPKNVIIWRCGRISSEPEPEPSPNGTYSTSIFQQACSKDNCGIVKFELSKTRFTCEDLGKNEVTATVTDQSGNQASTTAIITVRDRTLPVAKAKNITAFLDETGIAKIEANLMDNGSTGGCAGISLSLSQSVFDYNNLGDNKVSLIASDENGNSAKKEAMIIIKDTIPPQIKTKPARYFLNAKDELEIRKANEFLVFCENANIKVKQSDFQFSPDGSEIIPAFFENSSKQAGCTKDNTQLFESWLEKRSFTAADIGTQKVTVYVSDIAGNRSHAEVELTIERAPMECKNQLFAIRSGLWNDPNVWSDKPNGEPIGTIPCSSSEVTISGFKIDVEWDGKAKNISLSEGGKESTVLNITSGKLVLEKGIATQGNVRLVKSSDQKLQILEKRGN